MAGSNSTDINQLGQLDTITGSDNLAVWDNSNARTRKASVSQLLTYFQSTFTSPTFVTTINTPIEGFNLTMTADANSQWLLLTPASGLNAGTILLPAATTAADGQEVIITSTQQVATLTINANGATSVYGSISTIAAEGKVRYRFNKQTNSWYKV